MDGDHSVWDLVLAARGGQQDAWDELVDRFTPLVVCVVRRHRLRDADEDDVVQTLWLRLVEHLGDIRDPQALPGWIMTTTRNECLRTIKARQRSQPVDPLAAATVFDAPTTQAFDDQVVDDVVSGARHQALLAAFGDLAEHQRQLLALLLADPPLAYAEISRRLKIPIGSIGPTRARALQRIRQNPSVVALMAGAGVS